LFSTKLLQSTSNPCSIISQNNLSTIQPHPDHARRVARPTTSAPSHHDDEGPTPHGPPTNAPAMHTQSMAQRGPPTRGRTQGYRDALQQRGPMPHAPPTDAPTTRTRSTAQRRHQPPIPHQSTRGEHENMRDVHSDAVGPPILNHQWMGGHPKGLRDVDGRRGRCGGTCMRRGCTHGMVGRHMRGLGACVRESWLAARRTLEGRSCAGGSGLRGSGTGEHQSEKKEEKRKEKRTLIGRSPAHRCVGAALRGGGFRTVFRGFVFALGVVVSRPKPSSFAWARRCVVVVFARRCVVSPSRRPGVVAFAYRRCRWRTFVNGGDLA
jgi:hypothetical protein